MRANREIRAASVRVIDDKGNQLGVMTVSEALRHADLRKLDLVEIAPNATPPVCKIIDFGKYRYQIQKKEKEQKKGQHHTKVKEIKLKPSTDTHDLETKLKHARKFLAEGHKVRVTCVFRGREMAHPEVGRRIIEKVCESLAEVATAEAPGKMMGRMLSVVLSPGVKKKIRKEAENAENENQESSSSAL